MTPNIADLVLHHMSKDESLALAFERTFCESVAQLQADLDRHDGFCNSEPHAFDPP